MIEIESRAGLRVGVSVRVRAHELVADVATENGGDDAGPGPHDLYDAALGACKAITVMLYAKRKGIAVERIGVVVTRDASAEHDGTYRLDALLRIEGPVDEQQLRVLHDIAERCPIHRLMTAVTTSIVTRIERLG